MRLTTQFSASPVGRCSREKKNKTSTKADPAPVSSSLHFLSRLSIILQFISFEIYVVMKYMAFGFHIYRFLKVAVFRKATSVFRAQVSQRSSGSESGHTNMGVFGHTNMGVVLALTIQFSFLLFCD